MRHSRLPQVRSLLVKQVAMTVVERIVVEMRVQILQIVMLRMVMVEERCSLLVEECLLLVFRP